MDNIDLKVLEELKKELTPVKFVDYFTEDEIDLITEHVKETIKEEITPVKGVDYFDGESVDEKMLVKTILSQLPEVDVDSIKKAVTEEVKSLIPKNEDFLAYLKSLKGNDRLDVSNIRNAQGYRDYKASGGFNMNDQRWHGAGSGGGVSQVYHDNTLTGLGTQSSPLSVVPACHCAWGDITGDIADQTDLQNALDARVPYTGATGDVDLGNYKLGAEYIEVVNDDAVPTPGAGHTNIYAKTNKNLYYKDDTGTEHELVDTTDLNAYVPYNGAVQTLDMGDYNVKTDYVTLDNDHTPVNTLTVGLEEYWNFDNTPSPAYGTYDWGGSFSYGTGIINNGANDPRRALGAYTKFNGVSNMSISGWTKVVLTSDLETILYIDNQMAVYVNYPSGKLRFEVTNGTTTSVEGTTEMRDYVWHHWVCTFNAGVMKVYVDGNLEATTTAPFTSFNSSAGTTYLGRWYTSPFTGTLNGTLDEMGTWSKTLTAGEVSQLYNSGSGFAYPFGSAIVPTPASGYTNLYSKTDKKLYYKDDTGSEFQISTGGGGGTVTQVSVVSDNGFAGTVANDTTTPQITLSTTVTGIVKGDGTELSAATPSVDYVVPGDLNSYVPYTGANQTLDMGSNNVQTNYVTLDTNHSSTTTLTNNIESYWKLDGNSNDSVGSNNGSDTNITYSTSNGKINDGAGFNGTTSKIEVANSTSLNPTTAMTVSVWAKLNSTAGGTARFVHKWNGTSGWILEYANYAGGACVGYMQINGVLKTIISNTIMTTGVWYFITLTYDGTDVKMYVNGVSDATPVAATGNINTNTGSMLFGMSSFNDQILNGDIDEVGLWSRALTSLEVSQLYNSGAGLQYPFSSTAVPTPASGYVNFYSKTDNNLYYKDSTGTETLVGTGDVVGPGSSTDNAITRFDTTTGKLIQNSTVTLDDNGNIASPLSVQFGNGSAVTLAAGKMWYDNLTGSLNFGMGGGNITQQVGEEMFIYGKASSTITDSPLQFVYKTGVVGASGVITFAPTVASITDPDLILGVATESIATNGFGRITTHGVVHGITTNGTAYGETWADGDVIWYNPTTGNPTKTKPSAPNIKVSLGTVINAGSGGSGSFFVDIGSSSTLGGTDSNVQLGTLSNNDLLQYDSTAQYWKNVAIGSGSGIQPYDSTILKSADIGVTVQGYNSNTTLLGNSTTGTGSIVRASSPSLTTPSLGAATATTINKVTVTQPATGSTLTIADGKTLTANNSITLAGTDSTTMTFPSTSATIARTDAANTFTGVQTFSGAINEAQGADIASATTTDIGAATGNYVKVTGTTTITGLGTVQAGTRRIVQFSGALTLTYNATSLILPTSANITTAANDTAEFVSLGSGNWKCVWYQRADGSPLASSAEWTYYGKKTFSNSSTQQDFTSLPVHDKYKIKVNIYNNATNILALSLRLNGITSGSYNYTSITNSINLPGGQTSIPLCNEQNGSGQTAFYGEFTIVGKPKSTAYVKSVTGYSGGYSPSVAGTFLLGGSLYGNNADLTEINLIPTNAISGTVELWYCDDK